MQNSREFWNIKLLFKNSPSVNSLFLETLILSFISLILMDPVLVAQNNVIELDSHLHHLRTTDTREWSEFPPNADQKELRIQFSAEKNQTEFTLQVRQLNVKQNWQIELNNLI